MNIQSELEKALADWRRRTPQSCAKPTQLLLDDEHFDAVLDAAREQGVSTPSNPQYEEDRLEWRGTKIYRQTAPGIQFLPAA